MDKKKRRSKKIQEDPRRSKKIQEDPRRFKKIQEDSRFENQDPRRIRTEREARQADVRCKTG